MDTELGKGTTSDRAQEYRGIPPSIVAEATVKSLAKDEYEIVIGEATDLLTGARTNPEKTFNSINQW